MATGIRPVPVAGNGRLVGELELITAAMYLSSRDSSFATGIVLAVDGGRSYH